MRHTKTIAVTLFVASLLVIIGVLYYKEAWKSHLVLSKSSFDQWPSWYSDDQAQALMAFQKSCVKILKRDPKLAYGTLATMGKVQDWQTICLAATQLSSVNKTSARQFFETWFEPYQVSNYFSSQGLFTGYYLPLLHGSLKKTETYSLPIYGLPRDLVKVDLGAFIPDLSNTTITAQIQGHRLTPYPDRRAITMGAIAHTAPVLIWGDNAVDIAFAQIQGSARVQLPNGQRILIGYAGSNGHPYTPIGSVLIKNKLLSRAEVSMQTIRSWLAQHPDQQDAILNHNASYVFFEILKTEDPIGTQQVPLMPQRSLAVDTRYIPLGTPVWLETTVPRPNVAHPMPYHRLLIAQDTGGSIKGIVRGDVYWGEGDEAAFSAGHMSSAGKYWILLPRHVA